MKYSKILSIILLSSVFTFSSCNDKTKSPKQENSKPANTVEPPTLPKSTTTTQAPVEPSQNTGGIWHYTCTKGCPGGAGTAVNCTTCGSPLAHNAAYHANTNTTQSSAPFATPTVIPPTTQPGRNAAGEWHYTCGNGCVGGSGAAGNCGNCGGALAHNAAYH